MADLVVTVPAREWESWIAEGDLPGETWDEPRFYAFSVPTFPRKAEPGSCRVYVVAGGKLRGYSPLHRIASQEGRYALIRGGGAMAVTLDVEIKGFRGFRYRWWDRSFERPFPDWRVL